MVPQPALSLFSPSTFGLAGVLVRVSSDPVCARSQVIRALVSPYAHSPEMSK
jgi:hypothetical protein